MKTDDLLRSYRMLSECNQLLVRADDEETLARGICAAVTSIGGFDSAWMGLLQGDVLKISIGSGSLEGYLEDIRIRIDDENLSTGASGRALKDGMTHVYNDIEHDPDYESYKDLVYKTGMRSNMAVPLKIDGKTIGTLGIYSKKTDAFDEDGKKIFEELAGDLAYGIMSLRLKKRTERLGDLLKRIRMVNQRIAAEENLDALLDGTCEDLTSTNVFYATAIVDKKGIHFSGRCGEMMKRALMDGKSKLAFQSGDNEIKLLGHFCECDRDVRSACIKLKSGKNSYGTMFVCSIPEIIEDPEEQSLIKEIAGDLGTGMENIKSRTELLKMGKIIENISEEVYTYDPETLKFDFVNLRMAKNLGYTPEEFKDMTPIDLNAVLSRRKVMKIIEPLRNKEIPSLIVETLRRKKDGGTYPIEARVSFYDDPAKPLIVVVGSDISQRKKNEQRIAQLVESLVNSLSDVVEMKDPYTAGHQKGVSRLAVEIAKTMELEEKFIDVLQIGALLHDIGKISIPSDILAKPTKLRTVEFDLIRIHPEEGYGILKKIPDFDEVATIARQHHERLDGSGYPLGLEGPDISLGARIVGVADVVEAMTSHRPYRPALGLDNALKEILGNRGVFYDEKVVDACVKVFENGWNFH